MAQSIVSIVVRKLGELLINEVNFLQGVDGELRSLRDEFQWIQAFLKDADVCILEGNERVKIWVNQVRDVSYDAEDVIDTYIFKIHQHRRGSHGCLCFSWLTTYACHPCGITILHDLGNKIGEVKRKTEEISANRFKYGIQSIGATSSGSLTSNNTRLPLSWKQTLVVEEVDVIGFDEDVKALEQLLLAEDEGWRAVISIVGMGGLGKTTLAKKVFSNPWIKQHFVAHAWVYVSQSYRDRQLVESIANQLMVVGKVRMNESTDEELKKMVYEHLKERRYLVVIDDIWTRGAWDNIKEVLPAEMLNGSKVLLTTRNRDVALHADRQSPPFFFFLKRTSRANELKPKRKQSNEKATSKAEECSEIVGLKFLGEEESWELFCKKAIPTKHSKLALRGLALRKELSEEEWRKLLKSVSWQLREGEDQISKILALSYHHLPYYMKPCFLYFVMFPEDYSITAQNVRLMWIAEGFIEARGEETMEEVAEEYLEELVHRSLIQVEDRNVLGVITYCRIHDLLLDLAISEAKGTNFLLVTKASNNINEGNIINLQETRRLALQGHKSWDITWQYPTDSFLSLRTVWYFDTDRTSYNLATDWFQRLNTICCTELQITLKIPQILISMKLLRVVDLPGVPIILHEAIGELIHLRYLNVRVAQLKPLPSSIGELTNLQTLKIQTDSSFFIELPSEVLKLLTNLRHLTCRCSIKGQPSSVENLPNLQTLIIVKASKWLYKGLDKMTNLRKLSIVDVSNYYAKALSDSLGKLNNLFELELTAKSDHEIIPTSILTSSHHKHLRVFLLDGQLERLPEVITQCLVTNLIYLGLVNSKLKEDPLVTLGKLDNLQVLHLKNNAFVGKKMVCLEKGFPQLKDLEFYRLDSLQEWKIEDEAMPRLRKLMIDRCSKLVMLPHGLGRITSL
ncbi:disease resistance protein RPP8-like [Dioscorea cayenensis subsp. rotundata]|uniref:Disease resistance protein RPP8-like n=1 Tax=Dioscorea cayennensis subsp. rotundata TaxID=55577 RepID=A0AB40BXB5_DIOCR|nr:disease resistance protein RPP8-like [Dioscorea cayenensis subsp. rotundata]